MELQKLRTINETICINGAISYRQADRAWNLIKLKKEVVGRFPQLKEKRAKFSYKMTLYEDYDKLKREIRELEKNDEQIPILLVFYREKQGVPD